MPYHIEKRDDQFCVIKDDGGENEGCHDTEDEANAQMRALYASEQRSTDGDVEERPQRAPVEMRAATLASVDFPQRTIEIVAIPYGQEAIVEYRGELWHESVERGAFAGLETRPNRIKANRDHDTTRLVGKAVAFWPDRDEGLVGAVRIASTKDGDETLTLASEGMLDVSAGFAVPGSGQVLNRAKQTRQIRRAYLDHLAFVADGAYEGAQVVSVRKDERPDAAKMSPLHTPNLDEVLAWLESRPPRS
jgi:phage head maturation protease